MTKFILIDPEKKSIRLVEAQTWREAARLIDLPDNQCDHQSISTEYGMFVYEWGLLRPRKPNLWWRLDKLLLNGPAVIYREIEGENADCATDMVRRLYAFSEFIGTKNAVETAIAANKVNRPKSSINGKVSWRWTAASIEEPESEPESK